MREPMLEAGVWIRALQVKNLFVFVIGFWARTHMRIDFSLRQCNNLDFRIRVAKLYGHMQSPGPRPAWIFYVCFEHVVACMYIYTCAGQAKGIFRVSSCLVNKAVYKGRSPYDTDLKWNHVAICRRRWLRPKPLTGWWLGWLRTQHMGGPWKHWKVESSNW